MFEGFYFLLTIVYAGVVTLHALIEVLHLS
jgi:hypothetical protein